MTENLNWLSVPDFAEALGINVTAVREMLRERHVIAVRRGENHVLYIPAEFMHEHESGLRVMPTLRGTLTLLADARLSDEEAIEWLTTESPELGTTPLRALREGQRAPVRRAAQALM